ncbi:MAG: sulfate adenylyltransferase [Candidatus Latescibacterota bacterium]|nr:sulfate adenylyltransferase [Candidatus Latescibacterota bacterium]
MIKPHGSIELNPLYVADEDEREHLSEEAGGLPSITVASGAAASAVMLASGYFTPLTGFMGLHDTLSVVRDMKTTDGLLWPTPVVNIVSAADMPDTVSVGGRIALLDPNVEGNPVLAVQKIANIETVSEANFEAIIMGVFGTDDIKHPGVAAFRAMGDTMISGPIQVLNYSYFSGDFPETFRTAQQLRDEISERGWETVVAFQTRNPMHRAHEELCRMAQEEVGADGILIHMLLGKLKPGDIPADVRDASIRKMVDVYFPENTVLIAGYGFDMLYAGPREAVLHAIFRQNSGCTHLIVGRDHAGVGDYYGAFDAQTIFNDVADDDIEIEIYRGDHTAWSKKLNKVVMFRDAPDHQPDDFLFLSGTKVREMLAAGEALPLEFARPEVAEILMKFYQSEAAATS